MRQLLRPLQAASRRGQRSATTQNRPSAPNPERAKDQEFFAEFYPALKRSSRNIGAPYWKGPLSLVDGSRAEVVAMEMPTTR